MLTSLYVFHISVIIIIIIIIIIALFKVGVQT